MLNRAEGRVAFSLHDAYCDVYDLDSDVTCYEKSTDLSDDYQTAWERLTYQLRAKIADESNLGPYTVEKFRHDMAGIKARHAKLSKERSSHGG